MTFNTDSIAKILGVINGGIFILIMLGDLIVSSIDIIVKKTTTNKDDLLAQKIDFWWAAVKELYENFRGFADKFSAISRPRK